ncbi:MAG TPA: Mo-dependent nitrogenase C-terminal domain-containing protein [Oscillatoriaceae cyanobacterium M7585_C2015_266]|nr:Mo-dependent nitrogenase C-terminal domain-containing protein [Oscillatoriaceae cyanobacterium SKYGB_i_bin93]HIK29625.1 Mo-dependent nitrogenase C-terminal domain-containing protein [Oscillatoriaceae cyanobacterium M7585_C2015_266]
MQACKLHKSQPLWMQQAKNWLEGLKISTPEEARLICKLIPAQCPFEREFYLFGRRILRIPPLCKLNPFYEEFVGLRFRALCFLAEECGEDISQFLV